MKRVIKNSGIILIILLCFSCKKKDNVKVAPYVQTGTISEVLYTTAQGSVIISEDGGSAIEAMGVCWGTDMMPTVNNSKTVSTGETGQFSCSITGLSSGTTYYLRAYAINEVGTSYGDQVRFTTKTPAHNFNSGLTYGTVTDIDGNTYKTITIGSREWMAENLKTTHLNDGTELTKVTGNSQWLNIMSSAYCWFNDDTVSKNIYGGCYNWFAVNEGKLCPAGWHVPTDSEWEELVTYLGGYLIAGSKLKETGTNNWLETNSDATNSSGFTALPAGLRESNYGLFTSQGHYGGWWSSTEGTSGQYGAAWCRWIRGDSAIVNHEEIFKIDGFSVRCVKD